MREGGGCRPIVEMRYRRALPPECMAGRKRQKGRERRAVIRHIQTDASV